VLNAWQICYPKDIPEQTNLVDCGVFVLKYIECLSQNKPFDFEESQMSSYRRELLLSIVGVSTFCSFAGVACLSDIPHLYRSLVVAGIYLLLCECEFVLCVYMHIRGFLFVSCFLAFV